MYVCVISKNPRKMHLSLSGDLNFKHFPLGVYDGATPLNHWAGQTPKKRNLWEKTSVDKSAWIKAWWTLNIRHWVQSSIYRKQLLVFLSIACNSYFLQLINADEYLKRETAQLLTPGTKFQPFYFDLKTFLNRLKYSLETIYF